MKASSKLCGPFVPVGFRYTTFNFPQYRHLPGETPHPRRNPLGHQFGAAEALPRPFESARWWKSADYLFGVDLYNFAYFWEAHEAWEGIWKTTPLQPLTDLFLRGLIQVSAAMLKRVQRNALGARSLSHRGVGRLRQVATDQPLFCGIDLPDYTSRIEQLFAAESDPLECSMDPQLHLALPQELS